MLWLQAVIPQSGLNSCPNLERQEMADHSLFVNQNEKEIGRSNVSRQHAFDGKEEVVGFTHQIKAKYGVQGISVGHGIEEGLSIDQLKKNLGQEPNDLEVAKAFINKVQSGPIMKSLGGVKDATLGCRNEEGLPIQCFIKKLDLQP
ncbi:hypothetical protein LWI29_003722 [Acer saccharum]|uniref:Uncharacterized protein n=1 Tax=Acer saccharum TaxID=4024 RepID=A0AA39SQQ4_ACESA|nr:hypothetical protein LWI29_003722 [Acer saccharum]